MRTPAADEVPAEEMEQAQADKTLYEALRARVGYRYPYAALAQVPTKLAASDLSKEGGALAFAATRRPAFLRGERMTPAERGTALHTFMQFAFYEAAAADLEGEIARLVRGGFLTAEQGECLPRPRIRRFFDSRLYSRMRASRRCLREQHLTIEIPAALYRPGLELPEDAAGETMVVQGIADCVFEENGALIVVDYKTDRVKTGEELAQRYAPQLRIYAHALAQTLGLPVLECLLYSFALSSEIRVESGEEAYGCS